MAKLYIKIASSLILTTATWSVAFAEEKKFDHDLEAAAMAIAASKIGEIRNSIDYKQAPEAVLQANSKQVSKRVEKKEWVEPKPRKNRPQRISTLPSQLDYMNTGGVITDAKKNYSAITWQKFDRNGKPLNFLH